MPEKITSFEAYVETICTDVNLDEANRYAQSGKEFLTSLTTPEGLAKLDNMTEQELTNAMVTVLWCLMKKAYDDGNHFGRGNFTIRYDNEEVMDKLYKKFSEKYDSRPSSHFNDRRTEPTRGINKKTEVDLPWPGAGLGFRNLCIGKCKDPDGGSSIFIKPETAGLSIKRPVEAMRHLFNWFLHAFYKRKKDDRMENFREDEGIPSWFQRVFRGKKGTVKVDPDNPNRKSRELRYSVTAEGLGAERPKKSSEILASTEIPIKINDGFFNRFRPRVLFNFGRQSNKIAPNRLEPNNGKNVVELATPDEKNTPSNVENKRTLH